MLNDYDKFSGGVLDGSMFPAPVEIGSNAMADVMTPWDAFNSEPIRIGDGFSDGISVGEDGYSGGISVGEDGYSGGISVGEDGYSGGISVGEDGYSGGINVGNIEIGSDVMTPWDAFQSEPVRIGGYRGGVSAGTDGYSGGINVGNVEIGNTEIGNVEIGAVQAVIEKARDNRRPAPRMRAVDVDAPPRDDEDWGLLDTCIGAAVQSGNPDPFPILSSLLLRYGAGGEARLVRVDTEESYKQFRANNSPEMTVLRHRIDELDRRLSAHEVDPHAHERALEDVEDLVVLGAAVQSAEASKRVDLWLPKRFDGKWAAWREGDRVCASINLPGCDGEIRICTSLEPVSRCVAEMSRHAQDAGVPTETIVGVLPAMGCVLGAGTIMKEIAAAAPSILQRPEAAQHRPFNVRIEPKANPALCALAALVYECVRGNQAARGEWQRLADLGPSAVKQAMGEVLALVQGAAA